MKKFVNKYKHAWLLFYAFIYIPWFVYLEKTVNTGYHLMHTAFDDKIPFCEYFVIPYFLWFIYVFGGIVFFFFKDKQDYYRLCTFLFTGMTLCLLICTVYPNGTDLRPFFNPDKNIFTKIVAILYSTDTCTNVFPSIHVFNSIGTHLVVINSNTFKNRPIVHIISLLLTVSICLSTVFLKQHSVIDVTGAMMLSYVIYNFVYGFGLEPARRKVSTKAIS